MAERRSDAISRVDLSRRDFLRIIGVSGSVAAILGVGWKGLEENIEASQRHSVTRLMMGTIVNITLVSNRGQEAEQAIVDAVGRMTAYEEILSRFIPTSQLCLLNRNGFIDHASQPLLDVLQAANQISAISGGAFDITVKPVVDLYQEQWAKYGALPPDRAIESALDLVDYRALVLESDRVALRDPNMGVTLDGLAKGYIVDAGVAVLRREGYSSILVEAGGDLTALGSRGSSSPWDIGIESPRGDRRRIVASFQLRDESAATSGDYTQFYSPDYRFNHIIDPRTGRSPIQLSSTTVAAPSGLMADALATAVMVLGPEEGLNLIGSVPGARAYLITKDQEDLVSPGWYG
jgi:thiamine biosynthesis lipoprotein